MVTEDISCSYKSRMITFGKLIRILRERAGYSQVELANLIGYKSTGTISLIERGERDMSKKMMAKAADVLGVNERLFNVVEEDFEEEAIEMYIAITKLGRGNPIYESIKSQLTKTPIK